MRLDEQTYIQRCLTKEPPLPCPFKVGDLVTFTNDYGVKFYNRRVIGFSNNPDFTRRGMFIHLSKDAYWFPNSADQLELEA